MFTHHLNGQLTADRMHRFETYAAQHRLGTHAPATEVNRPRKQLLHGLLAAGAAAGTVALLVTQTAPRVLW